MVIFHMYMQVSPCALSLQGNTSLGSQHLNDSHEDAIISSEQGNDRLACMPRQHGYQQQQLIRPTSRLTVPGLNSNPWLVLRDLLAMPAMALLEQVQYRFDAALWIFPASPSMVLGVVRRNACGHSITHALTVSACIWIQRCQFWQCIVWM